MKGETKMPKNLPDIIYDRSNITPIMYHSIKMQNILLTMKVMYRSLKVVKDWCVRMIDIISI